MRENAQAKSERLLRQGRVSILHVADDGVVALVRGDSGAFRRVVHDGHLWTCTCPAFTRCSHALAVATVVILPGSGAPLPEPDPLRELMANA